MVNKKFWLGILVIVFVFGMMGCKDEPDDEEIDTWSNITSFSQMNGTWKGTYSHSFAYKELFEGMEEAQSFYGDMRQTSKVDVTYIFNATAKTVATSSTQTITFSGGNIDNLWPEIKEGFTGDDDIISSVTFNDATHTLRFTINPLVFPLSDEEITELFSGYQINQNGTKLKFPAGPLTPEFILYKQ
jgi:uncharacterized lipoprotein YehR (DUF1307 family)